MVTFSKNAYLCFGGYKVEDSSYCYFPFQLKDCNDTLFTSQSELCYECISCVKCYSCDYCQNCANSSDCKFCYDCRGCNNCFGSVGLRQKSYYFFNQPLSKEEYFNCLREWDFSHPSHFQAIQKKVEELRKNHPHNASVQINCQNCIGDDIVNSKNCYWAFNAENCEDSGYLFHTDHLKDSYDTEVTAQGELLYECTPGYDLYNCNFCLECGNTKNAEYCVRCFNSHDVFGCVGRNHAEFEILNQKYSKDEYFKKVAEIKDELRAKKTYVNWLPDVVGKID